MENATKKIVTLGVALSDEHKVRLEALGSLVMEDAPASVEDVVSKTEGADVVFSDGDFLLEALPKLKNMLVVYPFVELGAFNSEVLEKNGVFVANANGGNRDSIVEWTMYMMLSLFRNFNAKVRVKESFDFVLNESLVDKKVVIVGHGAIGTQVGVLCEAFGMKVDFFNRGDDLTKKVQDADVVVNALNCNETSENLLDKNFFMSLKKGAYYITFARPYTYDIDGLISAIDAGVVAGVGIDCDPEGSGDAENAFYKKCMSNEKILVTPHVAFATTKASAAGKEITIQNIEAFLKGTPQNIVKK